MGLGLDLHDDVAQRRGVICAQLRPDRAQQQAQERELDLAPPAHELADELVQQLAVERAQVVERGDEEQRVRRRVLAPALVEG